MTSTHAQARSTGPARTNTRIRRAPQQRAMGAALRGPGATAQHLQRTLGNQATAVLLQRMIRPAESQTAAAIQAKLAVAPPDEREASAVVQRDGPTTPATSPSAAPGKSAPSVAEQEEAYRKSYEVWHRYQDTLYGRYWYWETQELRVLPLLAEAGRTNGQARSLYASLQEQLRKLGVGQERVEQFARPPLDITKDISRSATQEAVQQAETAEGSKNAVIMLSLLLEDFQKRLSDAHAEVRLTNRALETAKKRERAAELRTRGEKQEKQIEAGITIIGAALEGTIGVITGGPIGAAKPAYDAIAALVKLFHENDLVKEAELLEKDARAIELEDAAERYGRAGDSLKHVANLLVRAQVMSKDVESDYERQRGRAGAEFDRTTRGAFRFGDVAQTIELADRTYDLAHQTVWAGYTAESAASKVSTEFWNDPWNQLKPKELDRTARAMLTDAQIWTNEAARARTRADTLRTALRGLRMVAHEALVTAPGTGKARRESTRRGAAP